MGVRKHFFKVMFVRHPKSAVALSDLAGMKLKRGKIDREFIDDALGNLINSLGCLVEMVDAFILRNPNYKRVLENTENLKGAYEKGLSLMDLFESAVDGEGVVSTRGVVRILVGRR
jgi:hypothetical protein